jgi:predicted nuclease with TOPRIM domain
VLSLILRKDLGNSSKSLVSSIATVLSKTDMSAERQEAIVGGLNEMIDGYEDIKKQSDYVKEKMSEFVEVINEVSKSNAGLETKLADTYNGVVTLIEKLVLQNAEIMDVLDSVYVNNRALSQGVKDFVALKHSENGKLVQETISFIHKDGESV